MKLDQNFLNKWSAITPDWGPVGEFVYLRTYSRDADNGQWWRTCQRVVEGVHQVLFEHCIDNERPYSASKAQHSAQRMFELMFTMKFLPPGRGIWTMGTEVIPKKGGAAANNCGFVSTEHSVVDAATWLMDMSMLGVGVGFDLLGAGKSRFDDDQMTQLGMYAVPDKREGWVEALYVALRGAHEFDYSRIRPAGTPINTFGGTASGPEPLRELIEWVVTNVHPAEYWTKTLIVDLMNMIGRCVVAGNVRRSAEIALGDASDEFLNLKNYDLYPEQNAMYRWASNNSVVASVGDNYADLAKRIAANGEPGIFWLENAQRFGRMGRTPDMVDVRASGCNPCQPPEATILTPEGIRTFADIETGDTIWSGKQWTKVKRKWCTGKKAIYRYHTTGGVFLGTENHRVFQGGERIEVRESTTIDRCVGNLKPKYRHDPETVMAGLIIGDGGNNGGSGRGKNILFVGKKDQDYFVSEVAHLLNGPAAGGRACHTKVQLGYLDPIPKRNVPERFVKGLPSEVAGFLRGLYSANGSVVSNRITLKTANPQLRDDVQQMLSILGIASYYTTNKKHINKFDNGRYSCKESYDINITSDRWRFIEYIGFIQHYKNEKAGASLGYTHSRRKACKVLGREYVRTDDVYDIEVEADEHSYWTGGLLVSNCSEQTLEHKELCCLVETFPSRHNTYYEYQETLKYAYLYAKAVTLIETHDPETNAIIRRNRRIGCSMSGVQEAIARFGTDKFYRKWCRGAYKHIRNLDDRYSEWLDVERSIKVTSIKPSGTVSLLPGVSPGVHFPISEYYYRCIRVASDSDYVSRYTAAGYKVVDLAPAEPGTTVIYFPVKQSNFTRDERDVSLWEQYEHVRMLQHYYADNQVSATLKFHSYEADQIEALLNIAQFGCKSLSMLPHSDHGYEHAPYQPISEKEYNSAIANLKPVDYSGSTHEVTDAYCDGEKCEI